MDTDPSWDRYQFKIEKGRLKEGSEIKMQGYFSGLYKGVMTLDLRAENRDVVFRAALRYVTGVR